MTKTDWLEAGFRALTKAGPQALKAEPLAKSLCVSKGSFYWHFKDIGTFKSAMISYWAQAATSDIIARIDGGTDNPTEKLFTLVQHATEPPTANQGGSAVESAIRDWGKYEKDVANAVFKIDVQRLAFTEALFRGAGQKKKQASQSARLLYSTLIGLQILEPSKLAKPQHDLTKLLEYLLTPHAAH